MFENKIKGQIKMSKTNPNKKLKSQNKSVVGYRQMLNNIGNFYQILIGWCRLTNQVSSKIEAYKRISICSSS